MLFFIDIRLFRYREKTIYAQQVSVPFLGAFGPFCHRGTPIGFPVMTLVADTLDIFPAENPEIVTFAGIEYGIMRVLGCRTPIDSVTLFKILQMNV